MPADSGLVLTARDIQTGEVWTFRPGDGGMGCPTLEKVWTGDGPITWTYNYRAGIDRMPPRHAHVIIEVEGEESAPQMGRVVKKAPPDSSLCEGPCTITTEGYISSLSDQGIPGEVSLLDAQGNPAPEHRSVFFGPVWEGSPLGLTPEAAINYAVRFAPHVGIGPVDSSGFLLTDTEDYLGRPPMDVVNAMTAMAAGFATPFAPSVRNGVFEWGPLDLGARYQVLCADGAVVTPTDDATRLYSRVMVIWGKGQVETYPEVIVYDQIPTIVDLVVNAGTEVRSKAAAQQLAAGLYSRVRSLELGWSCTINIPEGTPILEDGVEINPLFVQTQKMIRVADLAEHYDPAEGIPNIHLITGATWRGDEKGTGLTLRCGEVRDPRAIVRATMSAGSRTVWAVQQPGLSQPTRDANKLKLLGPPSVEVPTAGKPAQIDHVIPAADTKQQTLDPTVVPPQPPDFGFQINDADLAGTKGITWVQPERLIQYSIAASKVCTVTVTGRLVSSGQLILTLQLVAQQQKLNQAITSSISPLVTGSGPTATFADITARDGIKWEVTVADPAMESTDTEAHWVSVGIGSVRYFPGYKSVAPVTGGKP